MAARGPSTSFTMRKSNSLGQNSLRHFPRASVLAVILPAIFASLCVFSSLEAAQLKQARVSQVIRDVKLLSAATGDSER